MLLDRLTVYVPAQRERDADLAEHGCLAVTTRAAFGEAACEAGDPDHGASDTRTSAIDTIANVLHSVARLAPDDVDDGGAAELVATRSAISSPSRKG